LAATETATASRKKQKTQSILTAAASSEAREAAAAAAAAGEMLAAGRNPTAASIGPLARALGTGAAAKADQAIATCIFANGLPFRLVEDPFFKDMVTAVAGTNYGYKPPTRQRLSQKGGLLEQTVKTLKEQQERQLAPARQKFGLTIVSDGFTDASRRPLLNVVMVGPDFEHFITSIDTTGNTKNMQYIVDQVCFV
jgi:hypothetical protein